MDIQKILKPLRIDHWVKNLVILFGFIVALLYAPTHNIDYNNLILAFFILCISASSNYLINEYLDRKHDKNHPVKKWRYFVKNEKSLKYIIFNYFILILLSIFLSTFINKSFLIINLFFIFCGIIYNVKPFRFKEIIIIDVFLEAVNNPTRFLMGWVLVLPNYYPPISIILFLWLAGCFLMTMKRYSEFKFIKSKKIKPETYRKSFKKYNTKLLFSLSLFYCLTSFFFFTIFLIKYKIELLLIVPLVCYLYVHIFLLSEKKDSIIMKIEKIYKDKTFIFIFLFIFIMSLLLLKVDIGLFKIFTLEYLVPVK